MTYFTFCIFFIIKIEWGFFEIIARHKWLEMAIPRKINKAISFWEPHRTTIIDRASDISIVYCRVRYTISYRLNEIPVNPARSYRVAGWRGGRRVCSSINIYMYKSNTEASERTHKETRQIENRLIYTTLRSLARIALMGICNLYKLLQNLWLQ